MADEGFGRPPEIVAVRVGGYKALYEQSVCWSEGMALFGANGAGKTNFLEALAILMGTRETLRLAHRRLAKVQPGSLELLVRTSADELPWGPDMALNPEMQQFARALKGDSGRLSRLLSDATWWEAVGIRNGSCFLDGLRCLDPSPAVVDYLTLLCERPVVRYTLQDFLIEPNGDVSRRFTRTLVGVKTGAPLLLETRRALRRAAARLHPWPAGPGFPDHVDILPLPDTPVSPAQLEWLPRSRDWDEMVEDLLTAFRLGLPAAKDLAEGLALLLDADDIDVDPRWWLHSVAARDANRELAVTLPGDSGPDLMLEPRGDEDADFVITGTRLPRPDAERDDDREALERLSSGQRRWVDEAFATATRGLAEFAHRAAWQASVLRSLDPAELGPVIIPIEDKVRSALTESEFWTSEAKDQLLDAINGTLAAAAQRELQRWGDAGKRAIWEAVRTLSHLQPRLTVRVFDEPEAHLHPRAQRRTAQALDQLRTASQNIVLVSHSPHFLELTSWRTVHVQRRAGASVLSPLSPTDLRVGSGFASDLGLTRGELLTMVSLLLIVEGPHDQLVLESLYGTRLHQAGIVIARMHGTNNLMNVAQLDFIEQHLDIPVGVLIDYTRLDLVNEGIPDGQLRSEERKLRELLRVCARRQRGLERFALRRPDIIAYLNEDVIRRSSASFPGWLPIIDEFEAAVSLPLRKRPSFKLWLCNEHGVNLRKISRLKTVLRLMIEADLPAEGELESVLDDVVRTARASAGSVLRVGGA
ncbi:ATP-dependent nuclease [Micromonospora aurantiaca (nom. illeg.)]|uniref:ATP-dependent nuclease n=1 Tax=Micromonospora aurantiaca (nom. illeg.) TaxID=47850 RepID=UPI0037874349